MIARAVDNECERFVVDPRKVEASSRPDRQDQRGVRRSEAVVRALTVGIPTSGDAKSGHETARVVHKYSIAGDVRLREPNHNTIPRLHQTQVRKGIRPVGLPK